MSVRAFIGLGANLGSPQKNVEEAIRRLAAPGVRPLRRARLYRSSPVGPANQPDYVNTAVELETTLSPLELLAHAKAIERALGRVAAVRWGPRMVDLDLLLYGTLEVTFPELVIPHRELTNRAFVLAPLADLAPALQLTGLHVSASDFLARIPQNPETLSVLEDQVVDLEPAGA